MSTQILMPALSPTMEEGKLAKWHVKEGDAVKSGDILAEIETDKATMEFEAVDEGTISRLLVAEGTEGVKVNAPIAELAQEGEATSRPSPVVERPAPSIAVSVKAPAADKAPAPPKMNGSALHDPEIPEGTEFVTMTVRDALRDAMAEEMRRDENVFLMGEEVAEY